METKTPEEILKRRKLLTEDNRMVEGPIYNVIEAMEEYKRQGNMIPATPPNHTCRYYRSVAQVYPRKCTICGIPEKPVQI